MVTAEWRRRTQAEYASAATAHHVTLWLIQLGAPPDLIRDGLRVVGDELAHAELSSDVAKTAAPEAGPPVIEPAALSLPDAGDPLRSIAPVLIRFSASARRSRYLCFGCFGSEVPFRFLAGRWTGCSRTRAGTANSVGTSSTG